VAKSNSNSKYKYEVLCVDSKGLSSVKAEINMRYALLSNSDMFVEPKLNNRTIYDNKKNISIEVAKVSNDTVESSVPSNSYLINVKGGFDDVESVRIKLIEHLKTLNMEHIYVLRDDISSSIANDIYPLINDVENSLRRYLVKFLVTKFGPNWWKMTANSDMQQKAVGRRNNETVFSKNIDNNAYLIDFNELGRIIYSQSSGYIDRDVIVNRVINTPDDINDFKKLKEEIQSNYNKFFKETFKDNKFQQKWEQLEKIRHKVAHNNLFVISDKAEAESLVEQLRSIIEDADEKISALQLSDDEKADFQESIAVDNNYQKLSKEEMFRRLKKSYSRTLSQGYDFLGLKSFVVSYLGAQGYDINHCYELVDQLESEGAIDIYEHHGEGHLRPVRAVKIVNFDSPSKYKADNLQNRPFNDLKSMMLETES